MKTLEINQIKRIVFDGKKSRDQLTGRKVKFISDDITKQLKTNEVYTIKSISAGNYDAFFYLVEIPEKRHSEYSRQIVPNCYNINKFELV